MVRALLIAAIALWGVTGLTGLVVAIAGIGMLEALLPPLAVGDAALGGTVVALALGAVLVALAHAAVLAGLLRRAAWAWSGGVLLSGVAIGGFAALAAAALTSGAAGSLAVLPTIGATAACLLLGLGYAVIGLALGRDLRSGGPA